MTLLRSLLFIPGNQPRMLDKALGFAPDAYVPDLEDSVPAEEKANARKVTASFLPRLSQSGHAVIPRANALQTGLMEDDLAAVVGPHILGVSVGKVCTTEDIEQISGTMDRLEEKVGLVKGQLKLVPWIETAEAIVNVYHICLSSPRIIMGIERSDDDSEIEYARNVVCVAARAAGVLALDTPYFQFRDPDGLRRDAVAGKKRGFKGKFAIHPAQIEPINEIFSPSPAEIAYARRVVVAFEEAEAHGRGSTSLDGKVIDVPVVKRARALLEMAEKLNAIDK
jgi:citrate lyase subunit beta/citryl-CoA lyase